MYKIRRRFPRFWLLPDLERRVLEYRRQVRISPLQQHLVPKRSEYKGLGRDHIEAIMRGEVLKWGYRVWKGEYLPPEIQWIIVDFLKEDDGQVPGWVLRGRAKSHVQSSR